MSSIYLIGVQGGLVIGAALGGVIATNGGNTAPYWSGFVGSFVILITIWRSLNRIAHATTESAD